MVQKKNNFIKNNLYRLTESGNW